MAVVALRGLGGIGKSQLALEYAHRMRRSGRYQLAGWVRADSPMTITEDLAALAPLLELPAEGNVSEIAAQVVNTLRSLQDWLVIFDDAQSPGDLVEMLPGGGGHVLITSRSRVWSGVATQVDLSEFNRAESITFLYERSGSNEAEAAGELAEELGDLPLALAQAAAYIDTRSMTIRKYLELYRDPVLARRLRDAGLDAAEYPTSLARTWLLTFTQLLAEHPDAVELLRLCAFLDPDDIDLDLLSAGSAEAGETLHRTLSNKLERTETAGALVTTSLATVPGEGHLRVHRLVQAVTRDQLDDDEAVEWTKRALNVARAILPTDPMNYRSWPIYASLAPHIETITRHASSYPDSRREIASLLKDLADYLSESGQLKAARTTIERVLAINKAIYGPDHIKVAEALNTLAIVQWHLGKTGDARTTLEQALAIKETAYDPDHPKIATALSNLGVAQRDLGELRDGRRNIERALAIWRAAYGPDHSAVAKALANLGAVQIEMGEFQDARTNLKHALAIFQATDPNRLDILTALDTLGATQLRLKELKGACRTFEQALAIKEAAYGPDSLNVAITLINLSIVQIRLMRVRESNKNAAHALDILFAAYGPNHREVARYLVSLGIARGRIGRFIITAVCRVYRHS